MATDASHMLEAALEQMDDIIAGSKAVVEFSNGLYEAGSSLQILQLAEELRLALELQNHSSIRAQLPCTTAHTLLTWLQRGTIPSETLTGLCFLPLSHTSESFSESRSLFSLVTLFVTFPLPSSPPGSQYQEEVEEEEKTTESQKPELRSQSAAVVLLAERLEMGLQHGGGN
ncbi:hypothetical protein DNTS_013258 [Danionella cerebrum]|uniref:Uncharacterized protein n=1 Tax=Danionella cerebrum TaxID=2873325 RepID=A0A553Q722_9TELE|nr:hypothetical protein DNTS_013258 [Danionella translucida]